VVMRMGSTDLMRKGSIMVRGMARPRYHPRPAARTSAHAGPVPDPAPCARLAASSQDQEGGRTVWFLLFTLGAAFLHRLPTPRALAALPYPPPPEARYALFFLVAALLRLTIRNARVARLEKKVRRAQGRDTQGRFAAFASPPGFVEVGASVGKGVAEVVLGGDLLGAAMAVSALLLRFIVTRKEDPAVAARRVAERRRAMERERRRAALCVVGVGLACALGAWSPAWAPHAGRLAASARAAFAAWR